MIKTHIFKKKSLSKKREKLVSSCGSYYLFMCTFRLNFLISEMMKIIMMMIKKK